MQSDDSYLEETVTKGLAKIPMSSELKAGIDKKWYTTKLKWNQDDISFLKETREMIESIQGVARNPSDYNDLLELANETIAERTYELRERLMGYEI